MYDLTACEMFRFVSIPNPRQPPCTSTSQETKAFGRLLPHLFGKEQQHLIRALQQETLKGKNGSEWRRICRNGLAHLNQGT